MILVFFLQMDTSKPNVSGLVRSFVKILKLPTGGIVPKESVHKTKFRDIVDEKSQFLDEEVQNREAMEAVLAKVFASISSVKAAYAELQFAQAPYDAEGIQSADETVVNELKCLSELKQCYLKKQIDPSSPQVEYLLAEIKEQKSLLKTYEIVSKKFDSQLKVKDSEMETLKTNIKEMEEQNEFLEIKLKSNSSRNINLLEDLHLSGLNPNHFNTVLRHTVKSMQSFVKLMMNGMESSGWDLDLAAMSIEPNAKQNHKSYVFESYASKEMFDGFQYREFDLLTESLTERGQRYFFDAFMELKSIRPKEYLTRKPQSGFAKFCRVKYLQLVHPKMEKSLFGDLNQRGLVTSGGYPETNFFATFAEMAKRVWLLHCLAFSFKPEASIFQMKKGCRFSEVYMESVTQDAFASIIASPVVGFTVVPGFKVGKAVIQAQVYLSMS